MRTLSRHLPAGSPAKMTWANHVLAIVVVGALIGTLLVPMLLLRFCPVNLLLFLLFAMIVGAAYVITYFRDKTSFEKLMAHRDGESICTFRRAFNLRQVDPWIVRAVHEEVLGSIGDKGAIRASDRLVEDLQIDPEDLEDVAKTISDRAGYDFNDTLTNPLYAKVTTVGDLVMFFTHQRKIRHCAPASRFSPNGAI